MRRQRDVASVTDVLRIRPQRELALDEAQFRRILDIAGQLVSKLDVEAVLSHLLDAARDLTGARYAAIGILDEHKRELDRFVFAGIDDEKARRIGLLPRGGGLLGELIRNPRPLRLSQISEHARSCGFPAEHPLMTTFVGVPVIIAEEAWGNLYVTDKSGGEAFSKHDEDVLVLLAEWAANAIARARSDQIVGDRRAELERAVRGLRATVDLSREVGVLTELPRVLELVAKRGRALVDARTCLVLLTSGPDHFVVAEAAGESPAGIIHRELVAEGSAAADSLRVGRAQRITGRTLETFVSLGIEASEALLVPLQFRGRDLGVLAAFDRTSKGATFGSDEELLLTSFATSAASGIASTQAVERQKLRLSLNASELERQRWARELHDETLQELGALRMMQEAALQIDTVAAMRHALLSASEQVQSTIAGLEGLITELRPVALDQLGVEAALEALVRRLGERHPVEFTLDVDLESERGVGANRHAPELETTIYRVVQEALNNVVKHARALNARIAVEERGETVSITVEDDGRGIDEREMGEGFGLVGMGERVELVGGELTVGPAPEGGTRVTAKLPVLRRALDPHAPS